ncbi:hypothetical protein [Phormidesmis sp. 146-33]
MKFTDPKRFADHVGKQLKSHLVEAIGKELESKARSNNNALDVSMKDADHTTIREVQSWLRRRGWVIQNSMGRTFELRKG